MKTSLAENLAVALNSLRSRHIFSISRGFQYFLGHCLCLVKYTFTTFQYLKQFTSVCALVELKATVRSTH